MAQLETPVRDQSTTGGEKPCGADSPEPADDALRLLAQLLARQAARQILLERDSRPPPRQTAS